MRIARLRHRVTLQQATETRDAHGQAEKTWADVATVWAGVEPLRSSESLAARQTAGYQQVRVIIRHRNDVTHDWRIKFGTRIFEIDGPPINPDERNRELQILCREIL